MNEVCNSSKDIEFVSEVGLVRKANEDSFGVYETPNGTLIVVCDGMGGHIGGSVASKIAVTSFKEFFEKEEYIDKRLALRQSMHFANMQIFATTLEKPELKGMGTTAVLLLIDHNKLWYAHIGDSRLYRFSNGDLSRITKDHSHVQRLVDSGIISEDEAEIHPEKNKITAALGIMEEPTPEVCQFPLIPVKDEIYLVCTDGLSGMVHDELIKEVLITNNNLKDVAVVLKDYTFQNGATDNVTFVLAKMSGAPVQSNGKTKLPAVTQIKKYRVHISVLILFILGYFVVNQLVSRFGEVEIADSSLSNSDKIDSMISGYAICEVNGADTVIKFDNNEKKSAEDTFNEYKKRKYEKKKQLLFKENHIDTTFIVLDSIVFDKAYTLYIDGKDEGIKYIDENKDTVAATNSYFFSKAILFSEADQKLTKQIEYFGKGNDVNYQLVEIGKSEIIAHKENYGFKFVNKKDTIKCKILEEKNHILDSLKRTNDLSWILCEINIFKLFSDDCKSIKGSNE